MKKQNLFQSVLAGLDDAGPTGWPGIAEQSGVPFHTLLKIAKRITANPRILTVQALADHFKCR